MYAAKYGITVAKTDYLYPTIALKYLGLLPAMVFMLGLTAATFATTDSALTALTTSFCVDFLGFTRKGDENSKNKVRIRHNVHIAFSGLMLLTIVIFNSITNTAVVTELKITMESYINPEKAICTLWRIRTLFLLF